MIASTPPRGVPLRAFLLAVLALVLSGGASLVRSRFGDGFAGAWWIGRFEVARLGQPVKLVFGTRFTLASPAATANFHVRAERAWEALLDGVRVGSGFPGIRQVSAWTARGTFTAGEHEILVRVVHPEGAAALRLAVAFEGRKEEVVTGPGWRVDDDVTGKMTGFGGLRYPATLWARPPLSVFSISSSTRSSMGSAAVSTVPASSRMPSRAATE